MPDFGLTAVIKGIREGSAARLLKPVAEETALEVAARRAKMIPKAADLPVVEQVTAPTPVTVPDSASPLGVVAPTTPESLGGAVKAIPEAGIQQEAARLSALNLGKYDLGESYQLNYDMIQGPDDIRAIIADAAERNKVPIEVSRQGVVTHDELRQLGEDMGGKAVLEAVMKWAPGGDIPPPKVVLAARQLINHSADTLFSYAKNITAGLATDIDKIRFRRQLQLHDEFLTSFMGIRAEYGRGLNAMGIPQDVATNPLAARRMTELIDNLDGRKIEEIAAAIANKTSTKEISKVVKRTLGEKLSGVVKGMFYGSVLSSPTTHIINAFGGPLFLGMHVTENAVAARLPKWLGGTHSVQQGEAAAQLFGALTGVHDAFRYAKQAFKEGGPVSGARTRRGEADFPDAITPEALFDSGTSGMPLADRAIRLLGGTLQFFPQRVMVPTDEFTKGIARNSEAARLGFLKARDAAEKQAMSGDDFADIIRQYMDNPDEEALDEAARVLTYQNDFEKGTLSEKVVNIGKSLRAVPGGFIPAAFIKTPTHLFVEGLGKRSPLAVFNAGVRRDIAAGGRARDLALTRIYLGSMTSALVSGYAAQGLITGAGPQIPAERELWLKTHQPYSIKYYDPIAGQWKWQSIARFEPVSYVITAIADAVEIMKLINDVDERSDSPFGDSAQAMGRITSSIVAGIAENTLNKTFMTGVSDVIAALDDPGRYMTSYVAKTANAFLPFSSFRNWANKIEDPLVRQAWDELDMFKLKSGIPGLSSEAPPKRSVFGETQHWPTGSVMGTSSPWPDKPVVNDPMLEELSQVARATGRFPLSKPGKKIEGMKLTAHQYDELMVRARADPGPDGLTFRDAIQELIDSSTYQESTYDERALLLHSVQEKYDSRIRGGGERDPGELERDNPDIADALADFRMRKQDALGGF